MTRRHLALAAAIVAAPLLNAGTADAHSGKLTATSSCVSNGWTATIVAHNTEAGQSMTPETPGFIPSPIPAGANGTLRLTFPSSQAGVTIAGYFRWPDGYTDPYSFTVVAPTGCTPVTTTTVPPTTTVAPATTTVATSTTVAPSTTLPAQVTSSRITTTTHPEMVTDDPQTLPATGARHTVGGLMVGGGLVGLGVVAVQFAKRRSVES